MKQKIRSVIWEIKTPKQSNRKEKKNFKENEETLRSILDNLKCKNIHMIGIPEEERKQGVENLFEEIMSKYFLNLVEVKDTQVKEAQRVPNKLDSKRAPPRHIIIEMARLKCSKQKT